jgi:hypothetical protein
VNVKRRRCGMTNEKWTTIRQQANDKLMAQTAVEAFRHQMRTIFTAMLEGSEPPYMRRPTASLRLICQTVPASKLIVHPGWSWRRAGVPGFYCPRHGIVDLDRIDCELLQERITTVEGQPVRKFDRLLTLRVTPEERAVNLIHTSAVNDVLTALGTMEDFLNDPKSLLALSHDNCCCCGRGLRDELSRSRGIGPECIKNIGFVVYGEADWNGLVKEVVDA